MAAGDPGIVLTRFYIEVNGERVYVADDAADAVEDYLLANADRGAFVAYKTEGGKIVDVNDIIAVDAAADVDNFKGLGPKIPVVKCWRFCQPTNYSNQDAQINVNNITNCTVESLYNGSLYFHC